MTVHDAGPPGPPGAAEPHGALGVDLLDLLDRLRRREVRLWEEDGRLRFRAPGGALTDDLKEEIRARREELLELLGRSGGPAGPAGGAAAEGGAKRAPLPRSELRDGHDAATALVLPASFAQERLWFVHRWSPDDPLYNILAAVELEGDLDLPALDEALRALVARHETLRTALADHDGRPRQVIEPVAAGRERSGATPRIDLEALSAEARERESRRIARAVTGRPFDLRRAPLWRAALVRFAPRRHALILVFHHAVFDGWSTGVLIRDLAALYAGRRLSPLPVQYGDFAAWQREWLRGEVLERLVAHWRDRLRDVPERIELPADRPRGTGAIRRGASVRTVLTPSAGAAPSRWARLARERRATPFMVFLAAFQALLARLGGQDRFAVGTPVAHRTRREVEALVGFFVNTLVLDADLSDAPTFGELVERARRTSLEAFAHQDLPFEKLVEELRPSREAGHTPFLQAVLVLQNAPGAPLEIPDPARRLALRPLEVEPSSAHFDLTLTVTEGTAGETALELAYDRGLFDRTTARRFLGAFGRMLDAGAADPTLRVDALPLLSPGEAHQLLREWNREREEPFRVDRPDETIHRVFLARARERPDAEAVACGGRRLSYAELERRSRRLAGALREAGVRPGDRVALLLERSVEMVVALVGVLRAGGAYVPLEPALPDERLRFLVADAEPRLLLTDGGGEEASERLGGLRLPVLEVSAATPRGGPVDEPLPEPAVTPDHPAYVIYTSGSTGRPKGVVVSHRNAVRLLRATDGWFGFGPGDAWSLFHSYAFDFSVWELWAPLLTGGRVVVVPYLVSRAPRETHALLARERVTVLNQTPTAFRQLVRADEEADAPAASDLRTVIFGGEALEPETLRPWFDRHGDCRPRLVNMYGITETTVHVTYRPLSRADLDAGGSPVGLAIPDLGLRVLDRNGRPVPVGVAGELHVAGAGLASGYLGRPGLTAERFVPDGWSEGETAPGARLYRSGDLARYTAAGDLEYLGRIDYQVKIRGFRIELGEVEAALASHPAVAAGVVLAREGGRGGAGGEPRLVAWVVPAAGVAAPTVADLRRHLGSRLPEHMVPTAFALLDDLPRTPNGKLDRKALSDPEEAAPERGEGSGGGDAGARTATEEILVGLWEEVLEPPARPGGGGLGVRDHFFDLGGHSLLAAEVVARATKAFGVEVPLRLLFENPRLADLAEAVDALLESGAGTERPPLTKAPRDRPLPLSYSQERLWLFEQVVPGTSAYNTSRAGYLEGPLSLRALDATLDEIVRRHEALRAVFRVDGVTGEPVQTVAPHRHRPLPVVDLRDLPEAVREEEAHRWAQRESGVPFALGAEPDDPDRPLPSPLARALVLRLAPEEHVVVLTIHHIAYDLWSGGVLLAEVDALYRAFASGEPSPLPEPVLQYPDWAVWQRSWLRGEVLEAELAHWRERLAGLAASPMELPTDRPRSPGAVPGGRFDFSLDVRLADGLRAAGRRAGATQFMVHLALFEALLLRLTGVPHGGDPVVATAISNRAGAELEGVIGFFDNLVVLRTPAQDAPHRGFGAFLDRVREVALTAYSHQHLPFELLVRELGLEREGSRAPLVQAVLLFQLHYPAMDRPIGGLSMRPWKLRAETARFDLVFSFRDAGQERLGQVEYSAGLFDDTTIRRMAAQYGTLAAAALADPEAPLAELPLLTLGERQQALTEHNAAPSWTGVWTGPGSRPGTSPASIPDRLARVAAERPDAVALCLEGPAGEAALTFGALEARASRLAVRLAARLEAVGAGPESVVGVCLERSLEQVVSLLAVWKAGAAYLPLDPAYPAARLAYLLQDSGARVWIADASTVAAPGGSAGVGEGCSRIDPRADDGATAPLVDPERVSGAAAPGRLAYVIYTSGSTGQPKGVEIEHGALARLAAWHEEAFGLTPADRATHAAGLGFDASVWEIWPHLAAGVGLELAPEAVRVSPEGVRDWLLARRATVSFLPTPLAEAVVALPWPGGPRGPGGPGGPEAREEPVALRVLLTGGDRLRRPPRPGLPFVLVNDYGPTESAVVATSAPVPPASEADPAGGAGGGLGPSIGRPVGRVTAHVADARLRVLPLGVAGELVLGGEHLARGYRGRPALTAERFVPDPFAAATGEAAGARLYRTGDLVRRRRDGGFDFLGRIDEQIEVRGHRIEPGEIEAALGALPEVSACAVVAPAAPDGSRRLVAWVVAAAEVDPAAVGRALAERLPDALIPRTVLAIDALPVTPHGKIDRAALLERAPEPDGGEAVEPRTPLEATLAAAWADLLGRERVGIHDDFFALGGHSLLASQLVSRLRRDLRTDLPLEALFDHPTPSRLAARLEHAGAAPSRPAAPGAFVVEPVAPEVRRTGIDLSFAQERIWFLDRLRPGDAAYTIPLAIRLRGALSSRALERAVAALVRRHEPLRTRFAVEDGRPSQWIEPPEEVVAPVRAVDLTRLPEPVRRTALDAAIRREVARPFDLGLGGSRTPLLRLHRFHLGDDDHAVLLTVHHIVADGWSVSVLARDLEALYREAVAGEGAREGEPIEAAAALPELPFQHADLAAAERRWLAGPEAAEHVAWWRDRLAGVRRRDLPTDGPSGDSGSGRGAARSATVHRSLSPSATAALSSLARAAGASPFMVLAAALQLLIHRHTGGDDVLLGFPIAGRQRPGTEDLVGLFLNTLVLRGRMDAVAGGSFRDLLGQVRREALGAYAHQDVPFEKLLLDLRPTRDPERTPLFQVFLNMLTLPPTPGGFGGLRVEPLPLPAPPAKFDVTLYAALPRASERAPGGAPEGLSLDWVYRPDRIRPARMEALADQLVAVLAQVVADPDRELDAVRLAPVADPVPAPVPGPAPSLLDRFDEAARERPDDEAVSDSRGRRTYGQLHRASGRLAGELVAAGVRPGDVVAVHADRSAALVEALLAVLRAGAAFTILDAGHPVPRRLRQIRIAAPRAWIELASAPPEPEVETAVDAVGPLLRVRWPSEAPRASSDGSGEAPSLPSPDADGLATVAFTSGTGGEPKAIEGSRRPLDHFLAWHARAHGLGPDDRFAALSGLTHDPLLRDLFTPLTTGAALRLPTDGVLGDPWRLRAWLAEEGITVVHTTPSRVRMLAATLSDPRDPEEGPVLPLRKVFLGGEALRGRDVAVLRRLAPEAEIVSFYGTTETPQAHGFQPVDEAPEDLPSGRPVALGRGVAGSRLLVMTRDLRPAAIGELGEIAVLSPHLARGYRGWPGSTALRFVPADVQGAPGSRLYLTGDLGRLDPDGAVHHAGRVDAQVQLRGYRIEAVEVEAALERVPGVGRAVVGVGAGDESEEAGSRLVAWVVSDSGGAGRPTADDVRTALAAELPDPMVPSHVVFLDALPLTRHGKVDRRALPDPSVGEGDASRPVAAPRDRHEAEVVQRFEELLGISGIGVRDDFFRLGGHSLLAVRLVAELRRRTGRELPLSLLFTDATPAGLARWLRSAESSARRQGPAEAEGSGDAEEILVDLAPAASPASGDAPGAPLFLVHPIGGEVFAYGELAAHLGGGLPVVGLRAPAWTGLPSLEAMAQRYVTAVRGRQPHGPYRLGGWSLGGVVAFEMARHLRRAGEQVSLLVLIDSRLPDGAVAPLDEAALRRMFDRDVAALAAEAGTGGWSDGERRATIDRSFETFRAHAHALAGYRWEGDDPPAPEAAVLFRAADRAEAVGAEPWRKPFPGLRRVDLPGDHYSILRGAAARTLAAAIEGLACRADS